jgi:glutamyl-tRNA synthetase
MIQDLDKKILAYALKNAVEHEGKCQAGNILSSLFHEGLDRADIKQVMPKINDCVKKINSQTIEKQQKELEELENLISHRHEREGMPELEDVPKKGVIMRFSPSSSASAFHIGHILTGMPTCLYIKKYGGTFYLRIEDTNPEKTVPECYEEFPKEAAWIFGNITEFYAQSDRMQRYYDFAEKLINKGLAFICTCKKQEDEENENERKEESYKVREPCKCRNNSIKDNQDKWKKMLDKKGFKEGEAILRFKTSLELNNPSLIDFPLARINTTKHPRQGTKYRVWPLMNLCVTYDDMEQGCTHIIRAKEHEDNAKKQAMIFEALNIKVPQTYFLGRYNFNDLEISKTKITERIKRGEFSGWDDIRLPLARNFKRRGYQPLAFERMVEQRGLSKVDKVLDKKDFYDVLDNFNREIISPISIKATFTLSKSKEAIEILMDDAKIIKGKTDLSTSKLKEGDIVHFDSIGFARYNPKEKVKFWFCHK